MARTTDSKERLLKVAIELIWQQSYAAVSVDYICEKAKVNKGSFYHHFHSKSGLALAVFEDYWNRKRPIYDAIFSAQTPPLQRLQRYCEEIYREQKEQQSRTGCVLGCPFSSVGSELSTQDEQVRQKTAEILGRASKYLEATLRDARDEGLVPELNFRETAECIYSFILGKLLQARIKNDAELLKQLYPSVLLLCGAQAPSKNMAAAA